MFLMFYSKVLPPSLRSLNYMQVDAELIQWKRGLGYVEQFEGARQGQTCRRGKRG
jgi:hypothetical protein